MLPNPPLAAMTYSESFVEPVSTVALDEQAVDYEQIRRK